MLLNNNKFESAKISSEKRGFASGSCKNQPAGASLLVLARTRTIVMYSK